MKHMVSSLLLITFCMGLFACNDKTPEPETAPATPEKLISIQKAEEVEAILKEKAAADRQVIDEATQ